jgi:hypothetical protein
MAQITMSTARTGQPEAGAAADELVDGLKAARPKLAKSVDPFLLPDILRDVMRSSRLPGPPG